MNIEREGDKLKIIKQTNKRRKAFLFISKLQFVTWIKKKRFLRRFPENQHLSL